MCRISYEKCVCFIFLEILAVLSCSGFRIDNSAMTDISKINSHTSSSLLNSEFFEKLFSVPPTHRIRHHRQLRAQAHFSRSFEPRASAPQPNEHLLQIPSTESHPLAPTRPYVHPHRPHGQRRKRRQHQCQNHDLSWKAYKANTVVVAIAESTKNLSEKCTEVVFKVRKRIKSLKNTSFPVDDRVRLKFSTVENCQKDSSISRSQFLVKAKIEKSKEYILFLNHYGAHNYSAVFTPEPIKNNKIPKVIDKVTRSNFKAKPVHVMRDIEVEKRSRRLKLVCKVRGFPIALVYWKRNNTILHPNNSSRVRITQKKRKSTLVIKNPTDRDSGVYECGAIGADGTSTSKQYEVTKYETPTYPSEKIGEPCPDSLLQANFCNGRGTCFSVPQMGEYGCACAPGYSGRRCEKKLIEQASRYPQIPLFTCKVGLYTKNDDC